MLSAEELVAEIRDLLAQPLFTGEGYRKIWARLGHKGVRTSKDRVLRLLREHQLLSPSRQPEPTPTNPHEGTIVTTAPDQMWGAEATATFTETEGNVTVLAALAEFRERYNHHWIWERLNYRTPAQARRDFQLELEVAA